MDPVNSLRPVTVEAPSTRPHRVVTQIAAAFAVMGLSGCVDIDGGAVELSWSLRSFDGDSVGSCGEAGLQSMRICWQPLGDDDSVDISNCPADFFEQFPCSEANGTSGFTVPTGRTAFWLQPICQTGGVPDPATYQVPAPIVRIVKEGQISTLETLLVVVAPNDEPCPDAGCTCSP